jgi:hypothetical protein
MMATEITMSPVQRNLARVCLGLSNGQRQAFRNIAWACPGTDGHGHWLAMQAAGLATYRPAASSGSMSAFSLTPAGAALAIDDGESLPADLIGADA